MENGQLVFDNSIIQVHPFYPHCRSTLLDLSNKDYSKEGFLFNPKIECLDMDHYEKEVLHSSIPDNTMDAAIGVANYVNKDKRNIRLLLVELRMGYGSTKRFSETDIIRKITHTRDLLRESPLDNSEIFVYKEDVAPKAKRWFSSKSKQYAALSNSIVFSVSTFEEAVKDFDSLPYIPIYSEACIYRDLNCHVTSENWSKFFEQFSYWCDIAIGFLYKKPFEYEHLKDVLRRFWISFKNENHTLNEDEELDLEIIEEDYDKILF